MYKNHKIGAIVSKLHRIGFDDVVISSETADIRNATKLILPGVGAFSTAIDNLNQRGLIPILQEKVMKEGVPVLGICLGLQLMTRWSEEGNVAGFGWLDAVTLSLKKHSTGVKVPHMGWNTIQGKKESDLMKGIAPGSEFYFVHSYFVACNEPGSIVATTSYGCEFTSVIQKDNICGTQFHPEKSHDNGIAILKNFAECPVC